MTTIPTEILNILADSSVIQKSLILPPTLPRKTYLQVNKILEALGGKWHRGSKSHQFLVDPIDLIDEVLLTGTYSDEKKEFQFFQTPAWLAEKMIRLAQIQPGEKVLEPSAGDGAILQWLPSDQTECCELNPKMRQQLKEKKYALLDEPDFLKVPISEAKQYAVIIGNPPFRYQQDVDHVTHMISLASRMVIAVMSVGFTFRNNTKSNNFRTLLSRFKTNIIMLPENRTGK